MLEVYCYSADCKFNDGERKCVKRSSVNPADDDFPFNVMVGPYWICGEYEEGDKNGNDPR